MKQGPELFVIAGPTASGKSALALELGVRDGAEIVSADSQAVYKYFDVGTAKPNAEALARVRHHLISVVEPAEQFTAARFQAMADAAIRDISGRGRRVLVVGGTGLYIRALLHGLSAGSSHPDVRARLEEDAKQIGPRAMHARLAAVDQVSAERIAIADTVRVVRALEIFETTGTPASLVRKAHQFFGVRHAYTLWFLDPPREALGQAIAERTRRMFAGGLVEEVATLVRRGFRDSPAMRSVGYRQALALFEGRLSRSAAEEDTVRQTRAYAKRQRTWFRKEPGARFVAPPYRDAL